MGQRPRSTPSTKTINLLLLIASLLCAPTIALADAPKEVVPETVAQTQARAAARMCEDFSSAPADHATCLESCVEGWPIQPECAIVRRFGARAASLHEANKAKKSAPKLEADALSAGWSKQDAETLRLYVSNKLRWIEDSGPTVRSDLGDPTLTEFTDTMLSPPDYFEEDTGYRIDPDKYKDRLEMHTQMADAIDKILKKPTYESTLLRFQGGRYAWAVGDTHNARILLAKARESASKLFPRAHPWRAEINAYSIGFDCIHEFSKRPELLEDLVIQHARVVGEEDPRSIRLQRLLGRCLLSDDQPLRAMTVTRQAVKRMRLVHGESHPETAEAMLDYGEATLATDEVVLAKMIIIAALTKLEFYYKEGGEDQQGIVRARRVWAKSLSWNSAFTQNKQDLATASEQIGMAYKRQLESLGGDRGHIALAPIMLEMAEIQIATNTKASLQAASTLIKKSRPIYSEYAKKHGLDAHPGLARNLNTLMLLMHKVAQENKGLSLLKDNMLEEHFEMKDLFTKRDILRARGHWRAGDDAAAKRWSERALERIYQEHWGSRGHHGYAARLSYNLPIIYEHLHWHLSLHKDDPTEQFEAVLAWQGINMAITRAHARFERAMFDAPPELRDELERFQRSRRGDELMSTLELGDLRRSLKKKGVDPHALLDAAPAKPDVKKLCELLKERDAKLVNFTARVRIDKDASKNSLGTTAFVLDGACKLDAVDIGPSRERAEAVASWRAAITRAQECYKKRGDALACAKPMYEADQRSKQVYELSWSKLESTIGDHELLYVVSDRELTPVSFEGLVMSDDRYLIEKHNIVMLPYASALLEPSAITLGDASSEKAAKGKKRKKKKGKKRSAPRTSGALVVGDIDYTSAPLAPLSALGAWRQCNKRGCGKAFESSVDAKQLARRVEALGLRSSDGELANCGRGINWSPLRTEARAVAEILGPAHPDQVTLITGAAASEQLVGAEFEDRNLIHIATHGFSATDSMCYIKGSGGNILDLLDKIIRTGAALTDLTAASALAMTGAASSEPATSSEEDGLLDGDEIRKLNMTHVELVTLSACETGVGVEIAGDGVHSLTRAFIEAGAQRAITSLWQVPDRPTADLFVRMYTTMQDPKKPMSVERAHRHAKLAAIERARADGLLGSSFIWAGFPLTLAR